MNEAPTLFAFGAMHLVGTHGVINLLREAGYDVKQIQIKRNSRIDLDNAIDSLSYAIGISQYGINEYLNLNGLERTYMAEFLKGLNEMFYNTDKPQNIAYFKGLEIGKYLKKETDKIKNEIYGSNSQKSLNLDKTLQGLMTELMGGNSAIECANTDTLIEKLKGEIRNEYLMEKYGKWKEKNETFLKGLQQKGEYKELKGGVLYKELIKGKGSIPKSDSSVRIHYEESLIDGTCIISSYDDEEPSKVQCNFLMKGFATALTHMRVGSKWEVYIPAEQAWKPSAGASTFPSGILTVSRISRHGQAVRMQPWLNLCQRCGQSGCLRMIYAACASIII